MYLSKRITMALSLALAAAMPLGASADAPASGPYIGAGWGQFKLHLHDLSDVGVAVSSVTNSDDNAWKAFVGYRFNPIIGLEAAYVDYGRPGDRFTGTGTNGDYQVTMKGFSPSLIATIPIQNLELFAKAGYYYYDLHLKTQFDSNGTANIDSSHRRSDFLYGGGVGYTFGDHLHLRADYERVDIQNAPQSDAFWLNAAWRF